MRGRGSRWRSKPITALGLVRHAVLDYCEAAADHDPERMAAAGAILRRLGVPAGLEAAFAGPPPSGQ